MKHYEQRFATYEYNHCNILIYFCNIHAKYLQHTSETSVTLETYTSTELDAAQLQWRRSFQWRRRLA
jgi:hypothetical protein